MMGSNLLLIGVIFWAYGCKGDKDIFGGVTDDSCIKDEKGAETRLTIEVKSWEETTLVLSSSLLKVNFSGRASGYASCERYETGRNDVTDTKVKLDIAVCRDARLTNVDGVSGEDLKIKDYAISSSSPAFALARLTSDKCIPTPVLLTVKGVNYDPSTEENASSVCLTEWSSSKDSKAIAACK